MLPARDPDGASPLPPPFRRARAGTYNAVLDRAHPPAPRRSRHDLRRAPLPAMSRVPAPNPLHALPSLDRLSPDLPPDHSFNQPPSSDAGPQRSRGQRRSTVGADFHRPPYLRPVHEHLHPTYPLPPRGSTYAHPPPPLSYYRPPADTRRSVATPVSTPPQPPSQPSPSHGSRSDPPGRSVPRLSVLAWPVPGAASDDASLPHSAPARPSSRAGMAPAPASTPSRPAESAPAATASSRPRSTSSSRPPASSGASGKAATNSATSSEKPADRRRRRKIPFSYSSLIAQAISSSPEGKMTLREIYAWINWAYPDLYSFDGPDAQGWQNTVRHNLSLNKMFVKVPRSAVGNQPPNSDRSGGWGSVTFPRGKGGYWMLDSSVAGAPAPLPGPPQGPTPNAAAVPPPTGPGAAVHRTATPSASVPLANGPPGNPAPSSAAPRGEYDLDVRFQHAVALHDCHSSACYGYGSRDSGPAGLPSGPAPGTVLGTVGEGASIPAPSVHGDALGAPGTVVGNLTGPGLSVPPATLSPMERSGAGIRSRRRAATYNHSALTDPDYAYAYAYGAPYGAAPWASGMRVQERPRARGYTTTAAEVNASIPPTHIVYRPSSPEFPPSEGDMYTHPPGAGGPAYDTYPPPPMPDQRDFRELDPYGRPYYGLYDGPGRVPYLLSRPRSSTLDTREEDEEGEATEEMQVDDHPSPTSEGRISPPAPKIEIEIEPVQEKLNSNPRTPEIDTGLPPPSLSKVTPVHDSRMAISGLLND